MRIQLLQMLACLPGAMAFNLPAATHYVNVNSTNPVVPYTSWATAATNIQDAISFSSFGDTVLVTNGIYQYGGYSNSGSNRVFVADNLTVQSVNGPAVTVIKGYQVPGTTNGANAVRCVYLRDGTRLSGFTLTGGATQNSDSGGGVKCDSTNATITNCVIVRNSAYEGGGGAYYGTLVNCSLISNSAPTIDIGGGGGADNSVLINCLLTGNFAGYDGGGASGLSTLINCTVVSNVSGATIGGASGTLRNCIVYYNLSYFTQTDTGGLGTFVNCCTSFSSQGSNNFTSPPAFVDAAGGNWRLQVGSPCINAGNNSFITNSTDLDGNPRIVGGTADIGAYENKNTNTVHYVNLAGTNPVSPFTNWNTAATSIQNAVGAAQNSDFVVASTGNYETGSTIVYGQEANRVALTNAVTLLGLYGPQATMIFGGTHMRCVYVGSNAVLNGFTLVAGRADTSSGDIIKEQSGGGAWCESSGAVSNCVVGNDALSYDGNNIAYAQGGGIYGGTICNSKLSYNSALDGGGAAAANLYNCTVCSNRASFDGGGVYQSTLYNSIIYYNSAPTTSNYAGGTLNYCDTMPSASGIGNITNPPGFVNLTNGNFHLQSNSPCINSGNNSYVATNTDLDGNPRIAGGTVDMGAYEFQSPTSIISYAWLQQYGLPTDGSADYVDTDGDGMNNWQEWRAGTDPTNPSSVLQMLSATITNNPPGIIVTWQSVSGVNYFLQSGADLSVRPAFSTLQTNLPGQSGTTSYTDTTATNNGPYFYRVGVQ